MIRPILVETVEMQRGTLVTKRVLYIDDDLVSLVRDYGWDGPLAVDTMHRTSKLAIGVRICPTYVEIILDGGRACD